MKRILMATDLSVRSDRALQRALVLADDLGADVTIMHVVDDSLPESVVQRQEQLARETIEDQLATLDLASTKPPVVKVTPGQDYAKLIGAGDQENADLVVLGDHRHRLVEVFRGTTVERVVRFGSLPVLVVKSVVTEPYRKVLIPIDMSDHSKAAIGLGARLAPGGALKLLHATRESFPGFLGRADRDALVREQQDRVRAWLRTDTDVKIPDSGETSPAIELVFDVGEPINVIRRHCKEDNPDLIALGTHGRSGLAHAIIGSIAESLLADAAADVLVVKDRGKS